jgi:LuxR family glucitol operon transcriptional activator
MAGIGKTTLALEAAHRCLIDYNFTAMIFSSAQSQQFLGSHLARRFIAERNLRDLLQVIFRTLDYADELPGEIEEQILSIYELLTTRPTLIIIDNVEILADQSNTLEFIVNLPPSVKVIITSRVRLGLEGEVIRLEPLPVMESVALIEHQAENQNLPISAAQIKLIHRSTKGLPLAITYLIGSLSTTGKTVLQEPLGDTNLALYCFEQAVNQLRSLPDTIAYRLLLSLSLFPDGATSDAIAYLTESTEGGNSINPGLQELDRRSLTFSLAPERYHLHSLTQEYIQLELAQQPPTADILRTRWQNWYLDFTAPYGAIYWHEWQDYRPLVAEWKNLRAVVDWCIHQEQYENVLHFWQCLKGFTLLSGYWLERKQWLEWLQDIAQERQDLGTIAELKYHHSYTLAFMDETDRSGKAIALALEAWEMHQSLNLDIQFDLAMYIAALYIRQVPQERHRTPNLELAQTWIDRGAKMLADLPADAHRYYFQVYYYQAEIQFVGGEINLAYDRYLHANQIADKSGLKRFFYFSSVRMAGILMKQGQLIEAEERLTKALKFTSEYRDRRGITFCQKNLAAVKQAQNDRIAARELGEQAKKGFKRLGMKQEVEEMERFLNELK